MIERFHFSINYLYKISFLKVLTLDRDFLACGIIFNYNIISLLLAIYNDFLILLVFSKKRKLRKAL